MNCPRCDYDKVERLYGSSVSDAWDVLRCQRCLYTSRTSEADRRTQRDAYPDRFKMAAADIDDTPEVPSIPRLR